tara:strand:- start:963 stop:2117 length:1155 start_codon:yes stop_codon:yes gene_type:complete
MKKIYKYFINNDNHKKYKEQIDFSNENSLTQGYLLSRTRKSFLRNLEFNLNHYNKKVFEGFVEGNSSMSNDKLSGLNSETIKQINSKLNNSVLEPEDKKEIINKIQKFINNKKEFNNLLVEKDTEYIQFMEDWKKLETEVLNCKSTCEKNTDFSEEDKNYCKLGCHLKGPYIKDCSDTFISTNTGSCQTAANNNLCQDKKWISEKPEGDIIDANNLSLKDGCCACGGGVFGPPKMVINGGYNYSCNDIKTTKKGICSSTFDKVFPDTIKTSSQLKETYLSITEKNIRLMQISKELIDIITFLKGKNINLQIDTASIQTNFEDKNSLYENTLNEIKKFTKKQQQTLDLRVNDSILKKDAYEYRNYVWLILAISLGFAALNKIKNL